MAQNIFVIGLDEGNRELLSHVAEPGEANIHSLMDYDELRGVESFPVEQMIQQCEQRLHQHAGSVDAIVTLLDFPATEIVPILAQRFNVPGPTLEAVLACSHKFWARLLQRDVAPEQVPGFAAFDPYDETALDRIGLDFPFWIKPVNSFRSHLGFRINNHDDFAAAMPVMRDELPRLADPLGQLMAHAHALPEVISALPNQACIAEQIIAGRQCTLEGYVHAGEPVVYGIVDSVRELNQSTFARYQYPSMLPDDVQQRMTDITLRVMKRMNLDNSPFNLEMFYDESEDQIWILEINPRISQSHCELFEKVDGMSHHKVMMDVAMGKRPRMPHRQGPFGCAAKCFVRAYHDAKVLAVPDHDQLQRIRDEVPETTVHVHVQPGIRLSDLTDQESYSYEIADLYIGAEDEQALLARHRQVLEMLTIQLDPPTAVVEEPESGINQILPA